MPDYRPALNETESQRVDELMEQLKKLHALEDRLAKELRKLIYKIEKR
jgi:hypothetical protein